MYVLRYNGSLTIIIDPLRILTKVILLVIKFMQKSNIINKLKHKFSEEIKLKIIFKFVN